MLSKEEFRFNLLSLRFTSYLNFLPVRLIDNPSSSVSVKIEKSKGKWRILLWRLQFVPLILHCLYLYWRLPFVHFNSVKVPRIIFIFHLVAFGFYNLIIFWYGILFFKWPENFVAIFNQLFNEESNDIGEEESEEEESNQGDKIGHRRKFLWQYEYSPCKKCDMDSHKNSIHFSSQIDGSFL